MEVFKDAHVKFQAERVGNIYMLRNLEVRVGGLSYPRPQDRRLWDNQRVQWFRTRMFSFTSKVD